MDEAQQQLANLDERIAERVQAIRAERDWWPCQRGCDHCCRHLAHPPELSRIEWQRVDRAVAQLPQVERELVEQRIAQLQEQLAQGCLSGPVVCPYLNELEGACRIYDARPLACHTYGFFVVRDHDQYCQLIEAEVTQRGETAIVWGNGEAIRTEISQLSSAPIPFEQHYSRQDSPFPELPLGN